jgi:hypothetical protein
MKVNFLPLISLDLAIDPGEIGRNFTGQAQNVKINLQ